MQTLAATAALLDAGKISSRALVEGCLARIADPAGEGARAFRTVHADRARAMADAMDGLRRAGRAPGPFAGIPVSLKDLFDIAGEPTPAGSRVLAKAPPAPRHATVVARLLAAGLIPIGRTNMTEFAYSGLGINPHFGTPLSPWDRAARRIPGGSSSGAAVSVADGMARAALGTDTGGSCRIPAAFCGLVGYKPTARRVPLAGVLPLAPSLDSVGPLAPSLACASIIDAILAGADPRVPRAASLSGLRFAIPAPFALEGMDDAVAAAFDAACRKLSAAGARIEERDFPPLSQLSTLGEKGGLVAAEAYAWHRELLSGHGPDYDPHVHRRIAQGAKQTAADYIALHERRALLIREMDEATSGIDALLMPTVTIAPPRLADLEAEEAYTRVNLRVLRNTVLANLLDRCAVSLPIHPPGTGPVGLMLTGETMGDARLFALAAAAEAALAS
ncbi:MAG TPA: amidase [Acetobacteraceae bacterium]|nr:amidase [Acetobacteraceae bacterium]